MMTVEQKLLNEQKSTEEFLNKLARLVFDYRTEIPMGHLFGAMEIVKMRLFHEANNAAEQLKKEGQV